MSSFCGNTKKIITSSLLLMAFSVANAQDINRISVVCEEWKDYTNKDGTGAYWELIKTVYEPIGVSVETQVYPWARAEKMVVLNKADALVGDYLYPDKQGKVYLYPQWHISIEDSLVAVFLQGHSGYWDREGTVSLSGKTLGWIRGYDFDKSVFNALEIQKHEINNLTNGLKMLKKGRLDAIVDYKSTVQSAMQEVGMNMDTELTIETIKLGNKLFLAFANSDRSKKLIEIYDMRMAELAASGKVDEIYVKWGLGDNKFGKERITNE